MKKKIAVLLTALMVMSMGTTVFAATSPTASTSPLASQPATAYTGVANATATIDGAPAGVEPTLVTVNMAQVAEAEAQAVATIAPTAKVLQMVDVSLPVSFTKATITFEVRGVVAGQKIAVLHQNHDGSWETIIPDSVGNGTVTATFTSLSPVAFVAYNASAKTAETMPVALYVAVIGLFGAALCVKKVKFN